MLCCEVRAASTRRRRSFNRQRDPRAGDVFVDVIHVCAAPADGLNCHRAFAQEARIDARLAALAGELADHLPIAVERHADGAGALAFSRIASPSAIFCLGLISN